MSYLDTIKEVVPDIVKQRKQWVLTNRTKEPLAWSPDPAAPDDYGSGYLFRAQKNNDSHLMSFAEACEVAAAQGCWLGFVNRVDDGLTWLDIDYKPHRTYTEEATGLKSDLFDYLKDVMYIEESMSGNGCHILVSGKLPFDFHQNDIGIEGYAHGGFIALTRRVISNTSAVANGIEVLEALRAELKLDECRVESGDVDGLNSEQINNPDEQELELDRAFIESTDTWRNRAYLERIFNGTDIENDEGRNSEGDLSLMQMFYKFASERQRKFPRETAIRMFSRSGRAKYLTRKPDKNAYLLYTLNRAIGLVRQDQAKFQAVDFGPGAAAMIAKYQEQIESAREADSAPTLPAQPNAAKAPIANSTQASFTGFSWLTGEGLDAQPDIEWAIDGVFPTRGIAAVHGDSGSGKSFLVMDMIAAVAQGKYWFGHETRQMPISVFALEGEGGLKGRKKAWEQANDRKFPDNIRFWDSAANGAFYLRDAAPGSTDNRDRLNQVCADINANGFNDGIVVIDTLNQASDGADENSSRDMGELIKAMKLMARETRSLVIVVHHSTKGAENKTMRGHSSLQGALDGMLEVSRIDGDLRKWRATKVKDGKDGIEAEFYLESRQVGFAANGRKALTSVSVESVYESGEPEHEGELPTQIRNASAPPMPEGKENGHMNGGQRGRPSKSKDAPTYSEKERGQRPDGANSSAPPIAGAGKRGRPPTRDSQWGDIQLHIDETVVLLTHEGGPHMRGTHGAPTDRVPMERKHFIQKLIDKINPDDPKDPALKKAISNALAYAFSASKLIKISDNNEQYFWPN